MPKKVVVVLGMHRSGTSLVAGMLDQLGIDFGNRLIPPRYDNPKGFFEQQDIVDTQKHLNRLLRRRPTSVTGSLVMPGDWNKHSRVLEYKKTLSGIVRRELSAAGENIWGFKDPQTIRLLPLWEEIFSELDVEPLYILCMRHPAAVAESLYQRDQVPREHGELVWLQHYLDGLRIGSERYVAVIEYEKWFSNFDDQFNRLSSTLASVPGVNLIAPADARELIDADLNHSPKTGVITNPLVAQLYSALQGFTVGTVNNETLNETTGQMDLAVRSLQPWEALLEQRLNGPQRLDRYTQMGLSITNSLADTGPAFLPLSEKISSTPDRSDGPLSVCIVTYELEGLIKNTGFASEAADMALGLSKAGHNVTVLYVAREYSEYEDFAYWVKYYREQGVKLVSLQDAAPPSSTEWPETYSIHSELVQCRPGAYNAYQWLKGRQFDVIHGFDTKGAMYYALLAKRTGLRFHKTVFHVRAYGPQKIRKYHNAQPMRDFQELSTAYMERRVVEWADIVTAPTDAIFHEFLKDNYALAVHRCRVLPYIGCHHDMNKQEGSNNIDEIVFLGSLEPRKGLNLFVDGVDWLQRRLGELKEICGDKLPSVRFVGGEHCDFPGVEFLEARTAKWQLEVSWDKESTREAALGYLLKNKNKLVVFPSPESRPAIGMLECMQYGIPFLVAATESNKQVLGENGTDGFFKLHPESLSDALLRALKGELGYFQGESQTAVDRTLWKEWHSAMSASHVGWRRYFHVVRELKNETEPPLVSVCVAHFNRPHFLKQCLISLDKQTYRNFEVIIVDDGSTLPEAVEYLSEAEPELNAKGWKIVRQKNRYLGAVRNTGAAHASGKYCLFMDDDNYAKPNEIETFLQIAEKTGAEILTCFADVFDGTDPPDENNPAIKRITQVGDSLPMGLFRNGFGDSNCFVQKEFFLDIGGNSEDYKVGKDDQEFFARSVLNGARLFLVPEALYWYRETEVRMRSLHYNEYAGNLRVMRPYLEACHPEFRDVFRFAQGQMVLFRKLLGRERFRLEQRRIYLEKERIRREEARRRREAHRRRVEARRRREEEQRQRLLKQLEGMLNSTSWRITRPVRVLSRKLSGKSDDEITMEQARVASNPRMLLISVHSSISWKFTGPLRVLMRKWPFNMLRR